MKRLKTTILFLLLTISISAQLNTDRLTNIGRNALYFNDYVLAIQYFNQVIKVKPYLAEPYLFRAIAKIQLEDLNGAEKDCTEAIRNNPFLPGAYYTRGYVYMQLKRYREAEQDFSNALDFAPENKTYTLLRADARAQQQNYVEALQDIDNLLRREPHSPSINFEKGVICMSKKDTICALNCFSQAVQYDNQNSANWSARGLVNLMLEQENDALLDITKAINLGSKWAGDYINRGILFYRKHNYRGALADYDKAIELSPQDPQCYYNRGLLRAELGDYNRALDDLNYSIDLDADNTQMCYQRGLVFLHLSQWKQALEDFDRLIAAYPYFLPSYYLAAQAKSALNDEKGAFDYRRKAHELEEKKEEIQRAQQSVNTDVQIARAQSSKRDRRKEFSQNAAQNQTEPQDDGRYQSETRGSIQKRYSDVVNEPNIILSYYKQSQSIRRTNYSHQLIDSLNITRTLPSPVYLTPQEIALTADMVNQHFDYINQLSEQIEYQPDNATLFFARALEFALVQDYSSAIDDCTKAITLQPQTLYYFARANWRYRLLEYKRSTGEIYADTQDAKLNFEMMIRDYDYVINLNPDFAFAYYNKANILCTQKDFNGAIAYYTAAIVTDPDFAEAYFNRGLTYIFTDQNDKGLQDLSKAGELGIYQAYNLITRFQ